MYGHRATKPKAAAGWCKSCDAARKPANEAATHVVRDRDKAHACVTCDHCGFEFCTECGEKALTTQSGYTSCPRGHGKLTHGGQTIGRITSGIRVNHGVTYKQLNKPLSDKERRYVEVVSVTDDDKGLPVYVARAVVPGAHKPLHQPAHKPATISPEVMAIINGMVAAEFTKQRA